MPQHIFTLLGPCHRRTWELICREAIAIGIREWFKADRLENLWRRRVAQFPKGVGARTAEQHTQYTDAVAMVERFGVTKDFIIRGWLTTRSIEHCLRDQIVSAPGEPVVTKQQHTFTFLAPEPFSYGTTKKLRKICRNGGVAYLYLGYYQQHYSQQDGPEKLEMFLPQADPKPQRLSERPGSTMNMADRLEVWTRAFSTVGDFEVFA